MPFQSMDRQQPTKISLTQKVSKTLEQHLLESGYVDDRELHLAKKLQAREQGPLLMILLRLNFIDTAQLAQLWDFENA